MNRDEDIQSNKESHTLPSIVLASSSPRRQELLSGLGIPFTTSPSHFDESTITESVPHQLVEQLSYYKAQTVADSIVQNGFNGQHGLVVIGSDTVVVLHGEILGKPTDPEHAEAMLTRLQGQTHTVYSGLCLILYAEDGPVSQPVVHVAHEKTHVSMRPMSLDMIRRYISTGEPMDKAGAYAIQGVGATLVTGIAGDYFTVVGLPLHRLSTMLEQIGVRVL